MTDGTSRLPGQRLTSCSCPNADHPTPGTGRGAPEIDILEGSASYNPTGFPVITQSLQVAPFDIWYYPNYDFVAFPDYEVSYTNTYTGGPFQQAVSATTMLNKEWFDGNAYQKYAFEYTPGAGEDGQILWYVGDQMVFHMDGRSIGPNGNVGARMVPEEPMTMVLNLGFSHSWVQIDYAQLVFPAVMRVDYVRWYQKKGSEMVTCDPPGYETTKYIEDHPEAYTNPNFTVSHIRLGVDLESVRLTVKTVMAADGLRVAAEYTHRLRLGDYISFQLVAILEPSMSHCTYDSLLRAGSSHHELRKQRTYTSEAPFFFDVIDVKPRTKHYHLARWVAMYISPATAAAQAHTRNTTRPIPLLLETPQRALSTFAPSKSAFYDTPTHTSHARSHARTMKGTTLDVLSALYHIIIILDAYSRISLQNHRPLQSHVAGVHFPFGSYLSCYLPCGTYWLSSDAGSSCFLHREFLVMGVAYRRASYFGSVIDILTVDVFSLMGC